MQFICKLWRRETSIILETSINRYIGHFRSTQEKNLQKMLINQEQIRIWLSPHLLVLLVYLSGFCSMKHQKILKIVHVLQTESSGAMPVYFTS